MKENSSEGFYAMPDDDVPTVPSTTNEWLDDDVEARLRDMQYKGEGKSGIHVTQQQVIGALLHQGESLTATTMKVLGATRKAVADNPRCLNWDWTQEQNDIELMCADLICQDPTLAPSLPDELWEEFQNDIRAGNKPKILRNAAVLYLYKATEDSSAQSKQEPRLEHWPTPYSGRPAAQIPQRRFLLGQHYSEGACSISAAAGGIGKSTLSLLDAVSFRVGRNLLTGEILGESRRVWVWNAEDDVDEMERRITGICLHYGVDVAEIKDGLFLDSGYELPLELAQGNAKGAQIDTPLIDRIAVRVKEREIGVVMLDPLVALHTLAEADNTGHTKLVRMLSTRLAKPANCAVDINHHTRKLPHGMLGSPSVDDIRGAGGIVYASRSSRMLNPMTIGDAEKFGIEAEDRLSYYRLERVKANMAKRGTVCWVRVVEVPIANRPDGSYGDVIAVPVLWTPPDAMDGITDTIAIAIAAEIAKGEYKRNIRSGASWAGHLVGLHCGIDLETKSGKERARVILEKLIKRGILAIEFQTDKHRNSREYVIPGVQFKGGKQP